MKNISAVVLLAVTIFCPDTALAQRQTTHIATPVPRRGTATTTHAPSVLQDLLDRISALETALAAETVARFNADVMLATGDINRSLARFARSSPNQRGLPRSTISTVGRSQRMPA